MKVQITDPKHLELEHQEVVNVNGVRMIVLNTARQSFIARPEREPVFLVKGVSCKLKRLLPNGDYVLKPLDKNIEVHRVDQ